MTQSSCLVLDYAFNFKIMFTKYYLSYSEPYMT